MNSFDPSSDSCAQYTLTDATESIQSTLSNCFNPRRSRSRRAVNMPALRSPAVGCHSLWSVLCFSAFTAIIDLRAQTAAKRTEMRRVRWRDSRRQQWS